MGCGLCMKSNYWFKYYPSLMPVFENTWKSFGRYNTDRKDLKDPTYKTCVLASYLYNLTENLGGCTKSNETIAKELNMSPATVDREMAKLRALKCIEPIDNYNPETDTKDRVIHKTNINVDKDFWFPIYYHHTTLADLLYGFIKNTNLYNDKCRITVYELVKMFGASKSTIHDHLNELERNGLIRLIREEGKDGMKGRIVGAVAETLEI